jgi:hypothetical protein
MVSACMWNKLSWAKIVHFQYFCEVYTMEKMLPKFLWKIPQSTELKENLWRENVKTKAWLCVKKYF